MKVQDVMNREVETCAPGSDLAAAAMIMWRNDCGFVPVTSDDRKALGVITDRDICMAVATRHQPAASIGVKDVMSGRIHAVRPDDDIKVALEKMRIEKVRRLPVVARDGSLVGVVSINDIVLRSEPGAGRSAGELSAADVLLVMKSVCEHRRVPAHV